MPALHEYLYEDGRSPFQIWFDSLEPVAAAKVAVAKTKLSYAFRMNSLVGSILWQFRLSSNYAVATIRKGYAL